MEVKRLTVYREDCDFNWRSPKHSFVWCGYALNRFWHLPRSQRARVGVTLIFTTTPVPGSYRLAIKKVVKLYSIINHIFMSGHIQMHNMAANRIVAGLLKRHDRVYVHAIKLTGKDAL